MRKQEDECVVKKVVRLAMVGMGCGDLGWKNIAKCVRRLLKVMVQILIILLFRSFQIQSTLRFVDL